MARRGEHNVFTVAADGSFRVVAGGVGQQAQVAAIQLRSVNLVGVVNGPHVTLRVVGLGRTLGAGAVSGGIQRAIARGKNVAARGTARAGADQLGRSRFAVRRVHRHGVDLVAGNTFALVLKAQHAIVGGEVGLGVLPPEGKLAEVAQVLLLRQLTFGGQNAEA